MILYFEYHQRLTGLRDHLTNIAAIVPGPNFDSLVDIHDISMEYRMRIVGEMQAIASMMSPGHIQPNSLINAYRASFNANLPRRHSNDSLNDVSGHLILSSTHLLIDLVQLIDDYMPILSLYEVASYYFI